MNDKEEHIAEEQIEGQFEVHPEENADGVEEELAGEPDEQLAESSEPAPAKKPKGGMPRVLKWIGWILATPILLFLLLTVLLYIPFIQDFAVRQVVAYAEDETGYDIQLERLRISFPLDLDLQGLVVTDGVGDTLVATKSFVVDLDMARVLKMRVGVDAVELCEAKVNSKDMIATMTVQGQMQQFYLRARDVDLEKNHVNVDMALLQTADVDVALRDTIVEEEESEPTTWVIDINAVEVENSRIRFATAGDSLTLMTSVGKMNVGDGHLDLGRGIYTFGEAEMEADTMHFAMLSADSSRMAVPMPAFTFSLDDVRFQQSPMKIEAESFALNTATSELEGSFYADLPSLYLNAGDALRIDLHSSISRSDLLGIASSFLPEQFAASYPDQQLTADFKLAGNMQQMVLQQLEASLPGSLDLTASGELNDFLDSLTRKAIVNYQLSVTNIDWIRPLADGALDGIGLPPMTMKGRAGVDGYTYDINATLQQGEGMASVQGTYSDTSVPSYNATLDIQQLDLGQFLTDMPVGQLTAKAMVDGSGLDFLSKSTSLNAKAEVGRLQYDRYDLSNISLEASASRGRGTARFVSDNELLTTDIDLSAQLARPMAGLTFGIDLSNIDLHALGVVDEPLSVSMCMHLEGETDLARKHQVTGSISDIVMYDADSIYTPEDISLDVLLRKDTTHVDLASGDLELRLNGGASYDALLVQFDHFMKEVDKQLTDRHVDMERLRHRLPQLDMHLSSGQHNPAHDIMARYGLDISNVLLDVSMNPWDGLNGNGHIYTFNTGTMVLDTMLLTVRQDENGVSMDSRLRNGRSNPQISFDATLTAFLRDKGAGAQLVYLDDRGRKGVDIGMLMRMESEGFRMKFYPFNQILAYRTFHINDSNYVFLGRNNRVDADLDLVADDGTGLKLYSTPGSDALQDLSVAINHLNLGELTSVMPYFPRMTGYLHGDAHLIQTEHEMSVSADITAQDLTYEKAALGQVGLQAVYLPNADGSHFVDGFLLHEGNEVGMFSGTYSPSTTADRIDVDVELDHLPLSLANGFIPDAMATMNGSLLGSMHIGGTTDRPVADGHVSLEDVHLLSDLYSLNLRFQDDTIRVANSNLRFDNVKVYSSSPEPFVLDGHINFANLDNIGLNLSMLAKNYELINAKKTSKAVAYGKMYVDFNAMLRGTLDNMRLFGRLNVKSGTDLTYVLDDSPLTVEDQLADLVEFVDFNDTLRVEVEEKAKPQNLNMFLNIIIDDAAQAHCLLSADGSSYVNVEGGGTLNMTYTPEKDMQMTGRYTINKGTLKYTMMVIPLKEFTIKSGSYVEFRGPIFNPYLNLSATERLRTTITENDHPRSVNFDVGMDISQTLERMGLEFTLAAPEDMSIQNELAQMTTEQRGRVAVTMLATGMYIPDNGTASSGGFSTQNALNSFLQSQISNIAGKALKSVDISMGVEQGTSSSGTTTTDYSFSFAKRFWGNRISVIVGGKVSTGEEAQNNGQTIIDNVSVEYRLDKGATRYVNLFYDKNYESVLEGEIIEMGAGLVLRRKSNRLGELFIFKGKE